MTLFRYEARGPSGRSERGAVEAASSADAVARLRGRQLTPLALEEDRRAAAPASLDDRAARDLSRTLSQLLRSGLSFAQALRLAGEELDGRAAAAAMHLREAAERGEQPSRALHNFAGAQAKLLGGVILAGETSGRLPEALDMAAASFARAADLRARFMTALIYPAFVILATLATLASFMLLVVPTLAGAFEGAEAVLPQSTRDLLALSAWLQSNGLYLLLVLLAIVALCWRSAPVRHAAATAIERVLNSAAGFGVLPRLEFSAFAGLASLSLDAGVPSAPAFDAAAAGLRSAQLRARLSEAVAAVRSGERPSIAIARIAQAPRALVRLMQVGEETGALATALKHAAELMSAEAEQRLQRAGAVAGPLITLCLGGLVASVVVSLFLGLLALSDLAST
ncbi:MAG: type II secretion system F family protein [Hyphomonadaceae bacterium]|nr:type II secretion system F family protein [Hyphomonadaceae bacterium]